jgi:hypothetical protein
MTCGEWWTVALQSEPPVASDQPLSPTAFDVVADRGHRILMTGTVPINLPGMSLTVRNARRKGIWRQTL